MENEKEVQILKDQITVVAYHLAALRQHLELLSGSEDLEKRINCFSERTSN